MTELIIRGIPVQFPFEPYEIQKMYMDKLISCLETGGNGVLESPTGTGKTLCLLCASCAWLTYRKAQLQAQLNSKITNLAVAENFIPIKSMLTNLSKEDAEDALAQNKQSLLFRAPKIIYASRTHSQLTQVVQELKRTSYRHMKVSVLGSRDQMCIHPEVSKEESNAMKTVLCRVKTKSKTCYYYNNVENKKEEIIAKQEIMDIEDLVKLGRKLECCPYYTSRELNASADITFLPYNYLLDQKSRKNLGLSLDNSVVILDEAHNVEKVCEESVSYSLSSTDIALCIDEISRVMKMVAERMEQGFNFVDDESQTPDFTPDDLCLLKTLFLELEKAVDELRPGTTFPGTYMYDLLGKVQLTPGKRSLVMEVLSKIVTYLSTSGSSPFQRKGASIQKFMDLLSVVFPYDQESPSYLNQLKTAYKVHISMDENSNKKANSWSASKTSQGKIVNFWCFSPQFGLRHLMEEGIHSLILTSGTLAPLDSFISELGINVKETLENPHIVGNNQVCVAVLKRGPNCFEMNSSYNSRNKPEYLKGLGRSLVNLSISIPDGMLVFFPSYGFMKNVLNFWQQDGIWSELDKNKPIFVEPQTKRELGEVMNGYYQKIQDPTTRGACFMAVTRGKVSEGLDFADFNGRAVIIAGIPFPPFKDPRVELKKQYLDEIQRSGKKTINGRQWYTLEATKAINQAVGRVIRHSNDYGAIILCDSRFGNEELIGHLSSWVRSRIEKYQNFGGLLSRIRTFFRNAQMELPPPKGKPPVSTFVPSRFSSGTGRFDAVTPCTKRDQTQENDNLVNTYCNWNMNDYKLSDVKRKEDVVVETSIFSALEKPTTVIDLNEIDSPSPSSSVDCKSSVSSSVEPQAKKRKLKIAPLKFFLSASQKSCEASSSSFNTVVGRKENITEYALKVKNLLGKEACAKLGAATSAYKTTSNVKDLHQALRQIFNSESSLHLLQGYEFFVKKEHKQLFREMVGSQ